jgi:hypothetical protein
MMCENIARLPQKPEKRVADSSRAAAGFAKPDATEEHRRMTTILASASAMP